MTTETTAAQGNTETATDEVVVTETVQSTEATTENVEAQTETAATETTSEETTAENQQTEVEYNFALPEGYTADEELAGDLKTLAKENNLSPEAAQKLADLGVKQAQKFADLQAQAWESTQDAWVEQIKTDKEFGGDKFNENLAIAKKARDSFGGEELQKAFDETGLGNHPAIFRAFVKIGRAISDDSLVIANGGTTAQPKDLAKSMFPNMN